MLQPLLDRTDCNPAQLAPVVLGASFAAFLARILLLCGNGQLPDHMFDAAMSVAASANPYSLYLRHTARTGERNVRRGHWIYMRLRVTALAGLHFQALQIAVLESHPADMACLLLAEALFVAGFYIGACDPPRPPRRRVLSRTPASEPIA